MNLDAVDLNLLVTFDAVMQERNLTRAGRRLGLSQPATSHALARLRIMLEDELFVRTPDGMQPTDRAQQMAQPVHDALRTLRLAIAPHSFDPATSNRGFTLAMNNYAARAVAPSLVHLVAEAAPHVRLEIRPVGSNDLMDLLDGDGLDLALSTLLDSGERFKCVGVMRDDFVAVLDRKHPAANGHALSPQQIAEIPHIAISSKGDDTVFVDEALDQLGLSRKITARVPFLSIALMLVGSERLTVIPRRVAIDLASICPLVVRELPFPTPRVDLSMIWHRRVDKNEAHRWLRGIVQQAASG